MPLYAFYEGIVNYMLFMPITINKNVICDIIFLLRLEISLLFVKKTELKTFTKVNIKKKEDK